MVTPAVTRSASKSGKSAFGFTNLKLDEWNRHWTYQGLSSDALPNFAGMDFDSSVVIRPNDVRSAAK